MSDTPNDDISCSFCAKKRSDVDLLVTSAECCICDECIELCVSNIGPEPQEPEPSDFLPPASPPALEVGAERCSFCGRGKVEGQILVSGSDCYICTFCVWGARRILTRRKVEWTVSRPTASAKPPTCSFCGAASTDVWRLIRTSHTCICDACVVACIGLLDRELGKMPKATED